ncbi:MAG: ABC transporter substrate-binding protein, partial [Armatimonadetes bacterium]|nr:ABC transporter substrate-binding protein [Armatimonadota bacterium]
MDVPIERMTVRYGSSPAAGHGPIFVGIERGYFKERGIEISLDNTIGVETLAMVTTGELKIAGTGPGAPLFNALQRGLPLRLIASGAAQPLSGNSTYKVVVRKDLYDAGVRTVKDLKGKKIGFLGAGGPTGYSFWLALDEAGLTYDDVDTVQIGFGESAVAMSNRSLDAAILAEPWPMDVKTKGIAIPITTGHDKGLQNLVVMAAADTIRDHPNAVANFLIAYLKGARDLYGKGWKDPEIVKILAKHTKIDPVAIAQMDAPYIDPNGRINDTSLNGLQKYCLETVKLCKYPAPLPMADFIDYSPLKRAVDYLGEF